MLMYERLLVLQAAFPSVPDMKLPEMLELESSLQKLCIIVLTNCTFL